jgi:hypothetical protein
MGSLDLLNAEDTWEDNPQITVYSLKNLFAQACEFILGFYMAEELNYSVMRFKWETSG